MSDNKSTDWSEWAKWINESTTKEQRRARKSIAFPHLYGNGAQPLSTILTKTGMNKSVVKTK